MSDRWGCKSDELQEMIDYTLQQLHELGECEGPPKCGWCLDENEAKVPEECDCWDVHANLNLDAYTCECPCQHQRKEKTDGNK